jgi:hypothetical protein
MNFRAASLTLALTLGSVQFTSNLLGQSKSQNPNAQQDQQTPQSFVGKIVNQKRAIRSAHR